MLTGALDNMDANTHTHTEGHCSALYVPATETFVCKNPYILQRCVNSSGTTDLKRKEKKHHYSQLRSERANAVSLFPYYPWAP